MSSCLPVFPGKCYTRWEGGGRGQRQAGTRQQRQVLGGGEVGVGRGGVGGGSKEGVVGKAAGRVEGEGEV